MTKSLKKKGWNVDPYDAENGVLIAFTSSFKMEVVIQRKMNIHLSGYDFEVGIFEEHVTPKKMPAPDECKALLEKAGTDWYKFATKGQLMANV